MVFHWPEILKKFNILTYLVLLVLTTIVLIIGIIFYFNKSSSTVAYPKITKEVKTIMDNPATERYLNQLNNKNLSEDERYKALVNLVIYFRGGYSSTHNPAIRNYVQITLNSFAKENFPNQYSEGDFLLPCSDPQCGHEITSEFENIIRIIEKSNLVQYQKDIILSNLKTVAYKPVEDKFNATTGLTIVIEQLEEGGNAQASEAAKLLKDYLKRTYSIDYDNLKPE